MVPLQQYHIPIPANDERVSKLQPLPLRVQHLKPSSDGFLQGKSHSMTFKSHKAVLFAITR